MASGKLTEIKVFSDTKTGSVTATGNFTIGEFTDRVIIGFISSYNYGGFVYTNGNEWRVRFIQVASDNSKIYPAPASSNVTVIYFYVLR